MLSSYMRKIRKYYAEQYNSVLRPPRCSCSGAVFLWSFLIPDEVFDGGVEVGEGVGEAVVEGDLGGDALAVEKESGLIAEESFE